MVVGRLLTTDNGQRPSRRITCVIHFRGSGVHRLLGADLAQQRLVEVLLDDVRLLGVARHLWANRQVLELLAVDREVLYILLQVGVAVQRRQDRVVARYDGGLLLPGWAGHVLEQLPGRVFVLGLLQYRPTLRAVDAGAFHIRAA